jgi:hypothetical protein
LRYAEKSFEIRFCAALSAALMPFNRNPKWFGLTQAQERKKGIDAALGLGGSLVLFQFKAKSGSRIKIERDQLTKLTSVEKTYPGSTFYVFPEAEDIHAAALADCMFTEAWCCTPSALDKKVDRTAHSAAFTLDAKASALTQARPKKSVAIASTCKSLGCFCCPPHPSRQDPRGLSRLIKFYLSSGRIDRELLHPSFAERRIGIPIGRGLPRGSMDRDDGPDRRTITSAEMFEELLGEGAHQNLGPGLQALFIAH